MNTSITDTGIITNPRWFTKGFGFVQLDESTKTAFVRVESISEAGFVPADVTENTSVTVEYEVTKDGRLRAVRLTAVGNRLAPAFFKESIVDRDRSQNAVIAKVTERGHERYPLEYRLYGETTNGRSLWGTYPTLAQAREAIGRIITPPVPSGHGEKTNVARVILDKKKKKAA